MEGLDKAVAQAAEILKGVEESREIALSSSRRITRLSKKVIHAVHNGEDCSEDRKAMKEEVLALVDDLGFDMDRYAAAVDAFGEYAEAEILLAVIEDRPVPSFVDLETVPQSWVLGMADAIGELRRAVLVRLMDDRYDDAKRLFSCMEEMYHELSMFDVPDAVLPIRRKQDIARGVVDKTRSDIFTADVSAKLRA